MVKIETGNIKDVGNKTNGWVVGAFMPKESLLHSEKCELKWQQTDVDFRRESTLDTNKDSRTIGILISGEMKVVFSESGQTAVLSKPGDYIAFNGARHVTEVKAGTVSITVRWYE